MPDSTRTEAAVRYSLMSPRLASSTDIDAASTAMEQSSRLIICAELADRLDTKDLTVDRHFTIPLPYNVLGEQPIDLVRIDAPVSQCVDCVLALEGSATRLRRSTTVDHEGRGQDRHGDVRMAMD